MEMEYRENYTDTVMTGSPDFIQNDRIREEADDWNAAEMDDDVEKIERMIRESTQFI